MVIPAGILRILVFSIPVALFSQESRFLFRFSEPPQESCLYGAYVGCYAGNEFVRKKHKCNLRYVDSEYIFLRLQTDLFMFVPFVPLLLLLPLPPTLPPTLPPLAGIGKAEGGESSSFSCPPHPPTLTTSSSDSEGRHGRFLDDALPPTTTTTSRGGRPPPPPTATSSSS